jgi:hypothetical protein
LHFPQLQNFLSVDCHYWNCTVKVVGDHTLVCGGAWLLM